MVRKFIPFFGMRRSGNHAIIYWILGHDFLKGVRGNFASYKEKVYLNQRKMDTYVKHRPRDNKNINWAWDPNLLLINIEDSFLPENVNKIFINQKHLSKGKAKVPVLVLRDPFNLFASRVAHELRYFDPMRRRTRKKLLGRYKEMWISHAEEFLGETKFLGKRAIYVSYNRWFSSLLYRRFIAARLGIDFENSEKCLNMVFNHSKGSSFDGRKYDGKAQEMKVLERWKILEHNKFYRSIFLKDKKMFELSVKIFGHIKGTQKLLRGK